MTIESRKKPATAAKSKPGAHPLPRRSPQDRRQLILNAAREVFAGRDYQKVLVSEIVRRAGVAQGTFYLYFPTKQAILSALAEALVAELDVALDQVSAQEPTVMDFLRSMQKVAMQIMDRYSAILPLLDPEVMFFGKATEGNPPMVHLLATVERLIRRDQQNGQVSAIIDPVIASRLIVSGIHRNGIDCISGSSFENTHYTEHMLAFFAAALRQERP